MITRPPWRSILQSSVFKRQLSLIAIDEAHCIPEWFGVLTYGYFIIFTINRGSDFRLSFAELGRLRALTSVPFMALTASAPPETQDFIVQ